MLNKVSHPMLTGGEVLQNCQTLWFSNGLKEMSVGLRGYIIEAKTIHRHRAMITLYGDTVKGAAVLS